MNEETKCGGRLYWCRLSCVLSSMLLLAGAVQAKPAELRAYSHVKHLVPDKGAEQALGAFPLDSELFARTHNDFANMRLVDTAGTEIPFLVRTRTEGVTSTRNTVIPTRVDSIRELSDNRIEIEMSSVGVPKQSQEITLSTHQHNFEKLVTVYGMSDGNSWLEIATEVPIVDYSRFIDYQRTRIAFKPARYQRLRLVISDVTVDRELPLKKTVREALKGATQHEFVETSFRREDFRIDTIRLLGKKTSETGQRPVIRKRAVEGFTVRHEESLTVITFTGQREPVIGIKLLTSGINFSRPISIEGKDALSSKEFRNVGRGTYSHISIGDVRRDKRSLRFAKPARCTDWRITIDNKDNPGMEISGVELEEQVNEAAFLNTPTSNYRVCYGGASTIRPRYDVATILNAAGRRSTASYHVGNELANPEYKKTRWRLRVGGRAILSIAILLMVGALGWGVAVAAKKVELS